MKDLKGILKNVWERIKLIYKRKDKQLFTKLLIRHLLINGFIQMHPSLTQNFRQLVERSETITRAKRGSLPQGLDSKPAVGRLQKLVFINMYFAGMLFLKHNFFISGDPPPAPKKLVTPKKIEYVSVYRSAEGQLTLPYPYYNPTCFRISYNF